MESIAYYNDGCDDPNEESINIYRNESAGKRALFFVRATRRRESLLGALIFPLQMPLHNLNKPFATLNSVKHRFR